MPAYQKYKKGMEYLEKGEYEKALACFNEALEIKPDTPDFLSDRAVAYFHLRKFELSIIDLNRAQELEPQNGYRYSSRAYVKDRMNDTEGAIEDYKKAIEIDPEDAISYNNLGLLEEKLGYQALAKKRFEKADELEGIKKTIQKTENDNREKEILPVNEKKKTKTGFIKEVFTTGSGFRDFLRFIFNGFRIKK
ncbi:MAG: tetratricopeptide repeat protein [Bacteroidota bacterium]